MILIIQYWLGRWNDFFVFFFSIKETVLYPFRLTYFYFLFGKELRKVVFVFEKLRRQFSKKEKRLAVFVDGPNLLRKELGIDLDMIKREAQKFGVMKVGKVYLNQFASDKLVEAVVNQGFEPVVSTTDIDVAMACDATETVFNDSIDIIVFVTRDSDFLPAIIKAKNRGKETVAIMGEKMSAAALKNTADKVVFLKGKNASS